MKLFFLIMSIALLLGTSGCSQTDFPDGLPACIRRYVEKEGSVSVWRGTFQGETYYLVIPDCCDQFIELFDDRCEYICAPSGGFTGRGDGTCPAWVEGWEANEEVWRRE